MHSMDDIPYSRIRVIYVLRPCAVGFALRNVRDIFLKKMAAGGVQYSVACHNFETTVRNYSVTRRMLSIAIFAPLILSVSSKVLVKSSFRMPIFYLGSQIAPGKSSATHKPGLFCRNDYVNPSTQYSWFTGR